VQRALSDVLVNGDWSPLSGAAPEALAAGVYVSRYSLGPLTLWTVVNRGAQDYNGPVIDAAPSGASLYDVTAGQALRGGSTTVPGNGVAGILGVLGAEPDWLPGLLAAAAADGVDQGATFPARAAARRAPGRSRDRIAPAGAVVIDAGERTLEVRYRRRETGTYQGAPYIEEWKPLPPRLHDDRSQRIRVRLGRTAVASAEVTRGEFLAFTAATGYEPRCSNRYLGTGDHRGDDSGPVTCVNLDDARAYAAWAGARLPTEFEWQVAAADARFRRSDPWVWNWTESEHSDGITRFVVLKGGSDHESRGSDWYVDGGRREPEFSLKFLLPGLGLDRSPSVGFRLAWDLEGDHD
jgi:hypothetical protein